MNLKIIGVLVGVAGGVLVYIQYLRTKIFNQRAENASQKTRTEESEWKSLIDQAGVKVKESELEYDEASGKFRAKYPVGNNTPPSDG